MNFTKFFRVRENKIGLFFGSASLISNFINAASGIVVIKWMSPEDLGVWQSLSIVQLYLPFLEVGIPNGLNRELPFFYGRGESQRALDLATTAHAFMNLISLVTVAATIVTVASMLVIGTAPQVVMGVAAVGTISALTFVERYLMVTYRSSEQFVNLSKAYLWKCAGQICLLPFVYFFNYPGLLVYTTGTLAFFTLLMYVNRPIRLKPRFDIANFKQLTRTGFPVYIMGYLRGVSNSFLRVVLLMKSNVLSVGLFTPAAAVGTFVNLIPNIMASYLFPKMNFRYGETNDAKVLWPTVIRVTWLSIAAAVPFVIASCIAIPIIMNRFFFEYSSAIFAMQIFSANALFVGTNITHNTLYTIKAYRHGYVFIFFEFTLKFAAPFAIASLFDGNILTMVAMGLLVCNSILFILNIVLIKSAIFSPAKV